MSFLLRCALAMMLLAGACFLGRLMVVAPVAPGEWTWRKLAIGLPPSIQVFEGEARGPKGEPFHAWFALVDYSDRNVKAKPFLASDPSGRELPSAQARRAKALIAINGGYFDMESNPAKTYSLIMQDGKVLRENRSLMSRGGRRYFSPRSAFGITKDRDFEIAWAFHDSGKLWKLEQPALSRLPKGGTVPSFASPPYIARREWSGLESAVGAGPRLVEGGKSRVTFEDEVFFGSGFQKEANYARAAVGWTHDKKLILFVVDGLQPNHSLGLTLPQLAQTLLDVGCVEAMNLDGGGSAALVANGVLLNRPSDGYERTTTSILAIVPADNSPTKSVN